MLYKNSKYFVHLLKKFVFFALFLSHHKLPTLFFTKKSDFSYISVRNTNLCIFFTVFNSILRNFKKFLFFTFFLKFFKIELKTCFFCALFINNN